jgi:tetratricopeptide (TPR) repeat protein
MKLIATSALAIVAAAVANPASAQSLRSHEQQRQKEQPEQQQQVQPGAPQGQNTVKPSGKAFKAILDLQTAVKAKDAANIPAKVAAAQAVATTKEDHYLIAQLQLQAAIAANDNAAISSAVDAMSASGYLDGAKAADLYIGLGGTFYNNKQYAQAAAAYQKAMTASPQNAEAPSLLAESLFAAGQKAESAAAFQRAIQARVAAGQKPDEALVKRAVAVAYESQAPSAIDLARQWVAYYPSPSSWSDAIAIYRNLNHPDTEGTLDLLRLMNATGSLKEAGQYGLYARAAAEQNNFNEAQAILDAGIAAKVVNPASAEMRDVIVGLKAKPKATAADLAEATKTAQSGMALLRIGDRYYAMGDYAKAVDLYKMSMSKPGVDASVANLHIGMALARAGDKAGATAALNAVTGDRAGIAKFWLAYVNQKA